MGVKWKYLLCLIFEHTSFSLCTISPIQHQKICGHSIQCGYDMHLYYDSIYFLKLLERFYTFQQDGGKYKTRPTSFLNRTCTMPNPNTNKINMASYLRHHADLYTRQIISFSTNLAQKFHHDSIAHRRDQRQQHRQYVYRELNAEWKNRKI